MKPKYLLYIAVFSLIFQVSPISAESEAEQSRKPSWIERIFGAKEKPEQVGEGSKEKIVDEEKSKDKAQAEVATERKERPPKKGFSEEEREILNNWKNATTSEKKAGKPLPPGLQKKVARGGELPEGWKRKLEIGSVLDPDLEERTESLPEAILKRLPEVTENTEIVRIGDEIIRVVQDTREILDILNRRID